MDFALRGYLGPLKTFISEIEKPIQMDRNQQVAERFRRITAPFLLRRLKSDKTIISDLPEKLKPTVSVNWQLNRRQFMRPSCAKGCR